MSNKLMVVIPCYNEEEVLPETSRRLVEKMASLMERGMIDRDSRVLLVNDGSKDRTWAMITELHEKNPLFEGVNLSRNRGHQNALLAGLMTAKDRCDLSISMDADLQDDMDAMDRFIEQYEQGCDVVYGVRNKRDTDTAFKRGTALLFYRLMKGLGVDITFNHADYRLMSNRALVALSSFGEVNLFLRGLAPLVGFQSGVVTYDRNERFAGESKYPFKKMLAFAIDGITSFSVKPLRLITVTGIVVFIASLCMLLYTLISWMSGHAITGWTSTIASIWMIGGIQLLSLGVIGEYIGKIYNETKRRPRFIIERYLNENGDLPVVDREGRERS
ncbi:MAG: glycosyltransferase family 2 protein [Clostridia bacterium]